MTHIIIIDNFNMVTVIKLKLVFILIPLFQLAHH